MTARGALVRDEGLQMGGILDLGSLVVTAAMAGEDLGAVDDAHLIGIGEHGEQALHLGMGDRVIVEIEADIGCLAGLDGDALQQRIGIVRQSQQPGRFLGEGLADAHIVLSWTRPIRRHAAAPDLGLAIEVIHINK